jgi:glycosyltransferase involved in cell wall biosynthesis
MATHDAEDFVGAAVGSLLSLDYPNLRIVINDNASSDHTLEVVRELTRGDDRVTVGAWPENRGAAANFNHLMRQASGEYFFWASDHDTWHPAFVSELVRALEGDRDAVLAYPKTMLVDLDGSAQGLMDDFVDASFGDKVARYRALVWRLSTCNMVYGLMRRAVLQTTWGLLPVIGPDHLLLAQMALRGRFVRVDQTLFHRRVNRRDDVAASHGPEEQLGRVAGPAASEPTDDGTLFRELRDAHLKLVRDELHGRDRLRAELSTRRAFRARFGVRDPIASVATTGVNLLANARRVARHSTQA